MSHFKFAIPLLTFIVSAVTGCATSPADIRTPERQATLTVEANYQPVYRKILENARECYPYITYLKPFVVNGDIYTDTKSGVITVVNQTGMGAITMLVFDIMAMDDTHTKVTGSFKNGSVPRQEQILKHWAEGIKDCS